MIFTDLPEQDRIDIIDYVSSQTGYRSQIVEKDWWVTAVLRTIFKLPYANELSFKGGTNLSKCWGLIHRMSEDIDIAISREFLGFGGELSKTQVSDKLRRAACSFVRERMLSDVKLGLIEQGITQDLFDAWVNVTPISTTDPEIIYVTYKPHYSDVEYIKPQVKIEISGRSMSEPVDKVKIKSFIGDVFETSVFAEPSVEVNAVVPERTFLEKLFLLHEEFAKPTSQIRVERMSRHLYDIDQMLDTPIAMSALTNEELYRQVIEHRSKFIGLKGFDYSTLAKSSIHFIPEGETREKWANDYRNTIMSMVLGEHRSFDEVMARLEEFNREVNSMGQQHSR